MFVRTSEPRDANRLGGARMTVGMRPTGSHYYTAVCSSLLFPLHERIKGHSTVAARIGLEDTQWWSGPRLRELQLQRLKRLLVHAREQVPYYEEVFAREGFEPEQVQALEELRRLPFLEKPEIRTNLERLTAKNAGPLVRSNTGGSGGEPLQFFLGKERVSHDVAAKWRATRWWGVDIGDREIVVWGSPIELGAQDRIRGFRDLLFRTSLLSAFEMSEDRLDEFVASIQSARPRMLFGYPSALAHIAGHARKRGQRLDNLGIAVVFVTSERLYEYQRELISETLGCRVANGYGGRDAGFIAHECPEGGMHITAEDVIVEIVDHHGHAVPTGEAGEIVVTHLASKDFPFIRYKTGDVGALDAGSCPCGRGLPLLGALEGRTTDFVVAADGTVLHGLALIYVVRAVPGIQKFKIVQESREHTRIFLVPDETFRAESLDEIRVGVTRRLGESVQVSVELVSSIAPERSGKHRYVVSRVASV
jgi:phenylacetate-CoA ligase